MLQPTECEPAMGIVLHTTEDTHVLSRPVSRLQSIHFSMKTRHVDGMSYPQHVPNKPRLQMQYVLEQPGAKAVLNPACQGLGVLGTCFWGLSMSLSQPAEAQHAGQMRTTSAACAEAAERFLGEVSHVPTRQLRNV